MDLCCISHIWKYSICNPSTDTVSSEIVSVCSVSMPEAISYSRLALGVMASTAWQIYQFIFSAARSQKKKKRINFPVLDLRFHHFSLSPLLSLSFSAFPWISFPHPLLPWNWGKISEKLRKRSQEMAKGCREERFCMAELAWVWLGMCVCMYSMYVRMKARQKQ